MGFSGCLYNGKQRWFGSLASTCMTHLLLLLLLLLWDERRSQVGSREAHMQQGHTGRAMFSKRSNKNVAA
jgi:hypothetical protein